MEPATGTRLGRLADEAEAKVLRLQQVQVLADVVQQHLALHFGLRKISILFIIRGLLLLPPKCSIYGRLGCWIRRVERRFKGPFKNKLDSLCNIMSFLLDVINC